MIIEPKSTGTLKINTGVRTVIKTNRSLKYVIETIGGTIVEGTVTANSPFVITLSTDIKNIIINIDEDSIKPISLIE